MKLHLSNRVYLLVGITCAGLAACSLVSLLATERVTALTETVNQQYLPSLHEALTLINRFESMSSAVNQAPAEIEVAKITEHENNFKLEQTEFDRALERFGQTVDGQSRKTQLQGLRDEEKQFAAAADTTFNLAAQILQTDAVSALQQKVTPLEKELQSRLQQISQDCLQATETSSAQVTLASRQSNRNIQWVSGFVLLLSAVLAVYLVRRHITAPLAGLSRHLDLASHEVSHASGQVSSASQSLAEGAGEQAASLEETSSSLEEMSSMTKLNSENAQKANELAKQTRSAADQGVADIQAMNLAMTAIKTSSDDIAKIIKTIDEIAFQTNILALNAAVEAARAGETGMGFAVVADEVRNLAQRSAQAARETAAMIEAAIGNSRQGVEISRKVSESLNEIVTKARQLDELVAEVAGASNEQTQGITQINTAVGEMDKVTQSNAANAEESAAAAQELSAQAVVMKESVASLLQLVGGHRQNVEIRSGPDQAFGRRTRPSSPAAKRPPVNGNGQPRRQRFQAEPVQQN